MNVLGTVRFNRKNMHEKLRKLEKGDAIVMSQDDGCKVAGQKNLLPFREQWVTTILGGHRKTREPVKKPMPDPDCDKGMVGFDRMEQQIASCAVMCCYWKVCKT